ERGLELVQIIRQPRALHGRDLVRLGFDKIKMVGSAGMESLAETVVFRGIIFILVITLDDAVATEGGARRRGSNIIGDDAACRAWRPGAAAAARGSQCSLVGRLKPRRVAG